MTARAPRSAATRGRPRTALVPRSATTPLGGPICILNQGFVLSRLFRGDSFDAIRKACEREDLDEVDDATLNRLQADFTPPKGFSVKSTTHKASLAFLDAHGIRELIHRTKDADEAKLILRTPKAREIVEVGLILWVPLGEITYQLGKLGVSSS